MATFVEEIDGETHLTAYVEIKNSLWVGNERINDRLATSLFSSFRPLFIYATHVRPIKSHNRVSNATRRTGSFSPPKSSRQGWWRKRRFLVPSLGGHLRAVLSSSVRR